VTRPADVKPPVRLRDIRIPPEDAAFLVMLFFDVATTAWRQERDKWSRSRASALRSLEYALGHEGGFTTILRRARTKRR
jgi:hypothetical protein